MLLRWKISSKRSYLSKKSSVSGGLAIAVVGADGAGKSTIVHELHQWLSWKLKVRRYYMGSQEPSLLSRWSLIAFRIVRKINEIWNKIFREKLSLSIFDKFQKLLINCYYFSIGRDRYHRYLSGNQQASQGVMIFYDRYPLETVHRLMVDQPMDGPRIAAEAGNKMSKLTQKLSELEKNLYQKICLPDHIVVLHVSPDVSQQRKPDHEREMIENKSRALRQMDVQEVPITEIDADQPFEQVLLQIKTVLWNLL